MLPKSSTIVYLFWMQFWLVLLVAPTQANHQSSWLVINRPPNQNFSLTCQDSRYYPFNSTNLAKRIVWQVPIGSVSLHLETNHQQLGWQVSGDGKSLHVNPNLFPKTLEIKGIYKCAYLAPLQQNRTYYAWHYLTWAVDYYADENLLVGVTPTEKYSRNLITLLIVWASFLSMVILLKLLHIYSFESRNKDPTDSESMVITSLDNHIQMMSTNGK